MKNLYILYFATVFCLCGLSLTINAQCYPDRHNTTWHDGWISCDLKANPNTDRPDSHWILYNLGNPYVLGKTKIWNSNHPDFLNRGLKEIVLDYSLDGETWTEFGSFSLARASGSSQYEGEEGPDLVDIEAQYILITAKSNYGSSCFGLSEIAFSQAQKVNTTSTNHTSSEKHCMTVNVYPNPFYNSPTIDIKANCNQPIKYKVTDALGSEMFQGTWDGAGNLKLGKSEIESYSPGVYFLVLGEGIQAQKHKLMKLK